SVVMLTEASITPSTFCKAFSSRRASLSSARRLMTRSASPIATPYPARSTRAIMASSPATDGSNCTSARSDDRFTTAVCTPSTFFKLRSMVVTQLAQYIPVIGRVNCFVSLIIFFHKPQFTSSSSSGCSISPAMNGSGFCSKHADTPVCKSRSARRHRRRLDNLPYPLSFCRRLLQQHKFAEGFLRSFVVMLTVTLLKILLGVFLERTFATRRAKVIGLPLVFRFAGSSFGFHIHATNGVYISCCHCVLLLNSWFHYDRLTRRNN